MPISTNKIELQRFLGMINCMGKFIPDLLLHYELYLKDIIVVMNSQHHKNHHHVTANF